MEIIKHLVTEIGPRWSGRSAAAQAADYLAMSFEKLGAIVERQDYPFVGWDVDAPPTLDVLEPEAGQAAVALMEYSGSTPPTGIVGELRPAGRSGVVPGLLEWPRYAIVTDDDKIGGYLIAHIGLGGWLGPAIPIHNPDPFFPFPMAILAQADYERFEAWRRAGRRVRVHFRTAGHLVSSLTGHNVIATLPGESNRTIVFVAHLDTAYGTPGACNNAGGLQALYDLAARLTTQRQRRLTYRFLACDGGEWHYLGSRHFLQQEQAKGRLEQIVAGINIDTITAGDQFYFLATPETMRRRAERVVDQLDLHRRFRRIEYLGALRGSDHYSFIQAGIPAAEILFWPCTTYKLPEDDLQHVDAKLIDLASEIAHALGNTFEEDIK